MFGLEKKVLEDFLGKFQSTPFQVDLMGEEQIHIGEGTPEFIIHLNKDISHADLLRSTSLALGEAYMEGSIEVEGDLYAALNIAMSQLDKFPVDHKALKKLMFTPTSRRNQKKEVSAHYDIGNDFYKLWLDETLSYSCGYFKEEDNTLYQAQVNKVDHILKKLNLTEGMDIVDIGCGWGFLLLAAAKKYKIHGLGITLSVEQAREFEDRIKAENLEEYLEVSVMDYRDLPKAGRTFDRAVSVGMVEHVGRSNYPMFMETVSSVLRPEGLFLLHFISGKKESPGDPWIKKYIFPGGMVPSLREIIHLSFDCGFSTMDVESFRRHYNKTLLCWYDNFVNAKEQVRKMFDESFVRMWELYLCSCAASFNAGMIDIHQVLFSKGPNNTLPMTREYIYK